MFIGSQRIHIYLPGIRTLKEKRKYLNSLKDRIKNSLNLSVSEIAYQDLKQRSELGLCGVCQDKKSINQLFQKVSFILKKYPQCSFSVNGVEIEKK